MVKRATPDLPVDETAPAKPKRTRKAAAAEAPATEDGEKQHRRHFGRGWLAHAVEGVCRDVAAGKVKVDGPLTVHTLRGMVTNEAGEHPSTGAVSAVLQRWNEDGYVKLTKKPIAFNGYTAKWADSSLDEFLEWSKARKKKARAAS